MSNKIIYPRCFSQNISLYGKDKDGYQKYICKTDDYKYLLLIDLKNCTSNYPKCLVCGSYTYLHHNYKYYSRFTCNSKKCNHHFNVIELSVFLE